MCTKVSSCRKGRAYFEFETSKGQEGLREGLEGQEGSLDLVSKREVADDTAREQRELLLDGHGGASLRAHALWKEAGYTGCGDLGVLGDRDADPWRVRPQERGLTSQNSWASFSTRGSMESRTPSIRAERESFLWAFHVSE